MQYTKKLFWLCKSRAVILPKVWLDRFSDITEVTLTVEDNEITITPMIKPAQKSEAKK